MTSSKRMQLGTIIVQGLITFCIALVIISTAVLAQMDDVVVVKVNGRIITESDLRLAEAEIGQDLLRYNPEMRRRILIEFLIQNELFADAAERRNVAVSSVFKQRQHYWDRRSLRDAYFNTQIRSQITEAEARQFYDQQIKTFANGEQIRASQIIVRSRDIAKTVFELIAHDGDFADLARKYSLDNKSTTKGGDLGYFGKGYLSPELEKVVLSLQVGEVSEPIKTKLGWHIIKVIDKRNLNAPSFEAVKQSIIQQLVHDYTKAMVKVLRGTAKIEYFDLEAAQK